jgi:hypothetical protein
MMFLPITCFSNTLSEYSIDTEPRNTFIPTYFWPTFLPTKGKRKNEKTNKQTNKCFWDQTLLLFVFVSIWLLLPNHSRTLHCHTFQFPGLSNNNMADAWNSEVGRTITSLTFWIWNSDNRSWKHVGKNLKFHPT